MPEVAYVEKNVARCLCYGCPVQKHSDCAQKLYDAVSPTILSADPPADRADLPGLYCANGEAFCQDLDFTETCRCMGCEVYAQNGLDGWKYCQRGSAAKTG
jgi:hypothetical protein